MPINIITRQLEDSGNDKPIEQFALLYKNGKVYLYNGSKFSILKDTQYAVFIIEKQMSPYSIPFKLKAGFKKNELLPPQESRYGNAGYYIYDRAQDNEPNTEVSKAFVRWIHNLSQNEYIHICTNGGHPGPAISQLTFVFVDYQGKWVTISGNETSSNPGFISHHAEASFTTNSGTPAWTYLYRKTLNGFFYGDGYIKNGEHLTDTKLYFLYNVKNLKIVLAPTNAEAAYSKLNTFSGTAQINYCHCASKQSNVPYYYITEGYRVLRGESNNTTSEDIANTAIIGAIQGLENYLNSYFEAPIFSTGAQAGSRNYISDMGAYTLKFLPSSHFNKIKNISIYPQGDEDSKGFNNIYVQLKNNEIKSEYEEEYFEPLSIVDQTESSNYQLLAKTIDNIQSLMSNKSWNIKNNFKLDGYYVKVFKKIDENTRSEITEEPLQTFFKDRLENKYELEFYDLKLENSHIVPNSQVSLDSFLTFLSQNENLYKNLFNESITADLYVDSDETQTKFNLLSLEMFEAYTRGRDFIQETYTEVRPQELDSNGKRLMSVNDNYFSYKYTGRDFSVTKPQLVHECDLLMDTDVTLGDTYAKQTYFVEAIKYKDDEGQTVYKDTFGEKDLLKAIDATKYTEDDYEVIDGIIDLSHCQYYHPEAATYNNNWCDCSYGNSSETSVRECYYQKCGECPYRFTTEKHPRRIRTLEQNKSNRFNLIQETSKVFEVYPQFNVEYDTNGKVLLNEEGRMKKHISFVTEKGSENYAGFRYEKNLDSMSRSTDSQSITTKLFVETVDSELTETGICSIQTAPDNVGKNAYILDFSYYVDKGLLNKEQTQRDVWGIDSNDLAFLPRIGSYNERYDELTNLILNLQDKEMTTLQAENEVSITGITTALEERKKVSQRMYQFKETKQKYNNNTLTITYKTSDTYIGYVDKYKEQATILFGLVEDLFFTGKQFVYCGKDSYIQLIDLDKPSTYANLREIINNNKDLYCLGELFWKLEFEGFENSDYCPPFNSWLEFKELFIDTYLYPSTGKFGQYVKMYNQVKYWKKEREKILNKINDLADKFYSIYEPYIKEGTWTDSNYLTDNEYYWAANSVLSDSCKPQVSYSFKVIDISPLKEYEDDYNYDIGDTTFIEDIDFFGANKKTGLPNHQKVIISSMTDDLDVPTEDSVEVQNYTSQFEDLFEQITASVQSLTYNENTYKRASNFTAKQYVESGSLQGTLDQGNLTLVDSNDNNIILDDSGTEGSGITNKSSKYKLTGEGLYFSKDGGETWDIGIGPEGYNLDYAKFGQLDASKVQIVDGEHIYFLWDKNGINAYRNPAKSTNGLIDFARFNRYGLSLIEKNNVRLRAGYEFKTTEKGTNPNGNYTNEIPLKDQNVGFYLYNESGKPIFKTETSSLYNDTTTDYSARLSLQGEMFITNTNLSDDPYANGSVIGTTTGTKLTDGYIFSEIEVGKQKSTIHSAAAQSNYPIYVDSGDGGARTSITIEANSTLNCSIYKRESIEPSTDYNKIIEGNQIVDVDTNKLKKYTLSVYYCTIKNTSSSSISITDLQKIVDKDVEDCDIAYSNSTITPFIYQKTGAYREVSSYTVKILQEENPSATYTSNTAIENSTVSVTYYDSNGNATTKSLIYYAAAYNTAVYSYWGKSTKTTVDDGVTGTATSEVMVYLNNKLLNENSSEQTLLTADVEDTAFAATQGSERVFMVGLKGYTNNQPQFKNILSVLKNGMLYIGGEIRSESGAKFDDRMEVGQLPDRVNIKDASMIVANNGYIWSDWNKMFAIVNGQLTQPDENGRGSLMSILEEIFNAFESLSHGESSGGGGDIQTAGYYLEDPIEEV